MASRSAEVNGWRKYPPLPADRPTGARSRHICSKSGTGAMIVSMEFQDVVRTRKMVRRYADRPVDPAVVDRMLSNAVRAPSAGFSQGWSFLVLDGAEDVERFWAVASPPDADPSSRWLSGMRTAPVVVVPLSQQGGLPRAVRRAGQGLDGPGGAPLAGALLAHRHRHGVPADPADRGRRGARRLLLRDPARADRRRSATSSGCPEQFTPIGAITVGHRPRTPTSAPPGRPARRARKPAEEVVHRGRW